MCPKTLAAASVTVLLVVEFAFGEIALKATIPSDFSAQESRMAAGRYDVVFDSLGEVRLTREDRSAPAIDTAPVRGKIAPPTGKLVFNRHGDSYVLSEPWL